MSDIMFTILQAIIALSIILIMRYALPYLKLKLRALADDNIWDVIEKSVRSVEQTIKGSKLGAVKKEEVIIRVTAYANQHGIPITQEQISQLIETAVFIMNNEGK